MFDRLSGPDGKRLRIEAFMAQKIVLGNRDLAEELADKAELIAVPAGQAIIEQAADDSGVYLIIEGQLEIIVNGKTIAMRGPNDHVGEMATILPAQKRSATVLSRKDALVAKLPEPLFSELASRYPQIYRAIGQELSRRLLERNRWVNAYRDKIKVFIISSKEALPIARAVQNALEHDPFVVRVWPDGVFRVSHYTLASIEAAIDDSDFAIAIAHADDLTASRGKDWPSPRDNVIFELGLFMGRLGKARAILMEPREEEVKLPSDLAGVTTIPYLWEVGRDAAAMIAPACNQLRDHINELGPFNG